MYEKIKAKLNEYPLEIRILIIAAVGGMIFSVFTCIGNIFLDLGMIMIASAIGTAIVGLITLYFAVVLKSYRVPAYFGILSLMLVMYPLMWQGNGGSHGPMIYFMLFNAVFCAVLLAHLNYKIVLTIQLLVVYGLLLYEYLNPSSIVQYKDAATRSIDIGFSFTIVFLLIFYMVVRIMNEYNENIVELEAVKQELLVINRSLEVVAETDELTGLYNRRYIMNVLKRLLMLEDSKTISLIMIDVDNFKYINDTYGHSVGDEVLKKISDAMSKHLRKSDTLSRIGGEEFLILLPDASIDQAHKKAEELRKCIEGLNWEYDNLKVTISGGVYNGTGNESLDQLLEKVDEQLYLSKNSGRNRISVLQAL